MIIEYQKKIIENKLVLQNVKKLSKYFWQMFCHYKKKRKMFEKKEK